MSEELCTPRALKVCDETEIQSASDKEFECEPFSVCLPFGGSLFYNGGCINYEKGTPPADGTYGKIVIEGGCIVGVEQDTIPQYAATPCAPVPNPCDCGEGGGASISTRACNLITQDATGALQALLYVEGDNGVTISGCGTVERPLIISGSGSGGSGGAVTGTGVIRAQPGANNSTQISHIANDIGDEFTVDGFTFDEYGHLQSYTAPSGLDGGIKTVVGGDGIQVDIDNATKAAIVSLRPVAGSVSGTKLLGGYNVSTDEYGRVTGFSRAITSPAGTFTLGDYDVTTNAFGSITNIVRNGSGGGGSDTPTVGLSGSHISFYYAWDEMNADDEVELTVNLVNRCQIRIDVSVGDACSYPHKPTVYVDGTRLSYGIETTPGYRVYASSAFTATALNPGTHTIKFAYDRYSQGICAVGDEGGNASGEQVCADIYGTTVTQGEVI